MKKTYTVLDKFLVRTPLLPVEADDSGCDHGLFQCAVSTSSPSLGRMLLEGDRSEKTLIARKKFVKRMAYRPTPYGMYAGVDVGRFGEKTTIRRGNQVTTRLRPDMSFVRGLLEKLEKIEAVRRILKVYPNPRALERAGRIWIETGEGASQTGTVESGKKVVVTPAISSVLRLSSEGRQFSDLVLLLNEEFNDPVEQLERLISDLLDYGVLVTELNFSLCDWEKFVEIVKSLELISDVRPLVEDFLDLLDRLDGWDHGAENSRAAFDEIVSRMRRLLPGKSKDLVQIDTRAYLQDNEMSRNVASEIEVISDCLLSITRQADSSLDFFKSEFERNYPIGREVPITELMSETFGLGSLYKQSSYSSNMSRTRCLLDMAITAAKEAKLELELTDDIMSALRVEDNRKPADSLDLFVAVVADSRAKIDEGEFKLVVTPRGVSIGGGRAMARFYDLFESGEVADYLRQIAVMEQEQTADLIVDGVFWPLKPRSANIAIVPRIRNFVVTCNSAPVDSDHHIPLSEISIGLSDRRKLYARWQRTGQKLSVRLPHLLNASTAPKELRLLLDIASQDCRPVRGFDWELGWELPFRPRLIRGRTVLSPASWNLSKLCADVKLQDSPKEIARQIDSWRQQWNVPASIIFADSYYSDTGLVLSLDQESDIGLFADLLKRNRYSSPVALEHLPINDWHTTPDGSYATEIVATLVKSEIDKDEIELAKLTAVPLAVGSSSYLRLPGSEWAYLRLDCSKSVHNEILLDLFGKAQNWKQRGLVSSWFFVRYADPYTHLRIRFKIGCHESSKAALAEINAWAAETVRQGLTRKLSFETYDREIERYGGPQAMPITEDLFALDSEEILQLFSLPEFVDLSPLVLSAISIYPILTAFKFEQDLAAQAKWLAYTGSSLSAPQQSELARLYRSDISSLLLLEEGKPVYAKYANAMEIVRDFSRRKQPLIDKLRDLDSHKLMNRLSFNRNAQMHMHCNRLYGDNILEYGARATLAKAVSSIGKRFPELTSLRF
ncbi:MAG: lantibiotic dehydratase [Cyanobacteria bacterium HKST-UBA02]|nr:lantibiotic dehydratase [Cyanobacteria bacterium HKST-UBA02]